MQVHFTQACTKVEIGEACPSLPLEKNARKRLSYL